MINLKVKPLKEWLNTRKAQKALAIAAKIIDIKSIESKLQYNNVPLDKIAAERAKLAVLQFELSAMQQTPANIWHKDKPKLDKRRFNKWKNKTEKNALILEPISA
ncbi:MAG: hypothetical protein OXE99_06085 [Cellvibrionales bacterium]|nr:hypothetical protein [Cellvibrionales bacterium]